MIAETITHTIPLQRWPAGFPPEALGTPAFWSAPIDQMYAQLPFPDFWLEYRLTVFNMDDPELKRRRALGQATLLDFNMQLAGYQYAAGLFWPRPRCELELGVYPPQPSPGDYTGPARPVSPAALASAALTLAHETGHYADNTTGIFTQRDDITRLCLAYWRSQKGQLQGSNEAETFAEGWRAAMGCQQTRGTFSDGKPANLSPELQAFYKCLYWLTASLAGRWVVSLVPFAGGVMYQTWQGLGWRWRVIFTDWSQQEHTAAGWQPI